MIMVAIGMIVTSCGKGVNTNVGLKSDVDSAFYAIGVNYGSVLRESLKQLPGSDGIVNYDAVIAGFAASMKDDATLKMKPEDAQMYIQTYVTETERRDAEKGRAEGEAFLAANKTKTGVITTESGLQYKVITEGTGGRRPVQNDVVIAHYTGRLLDGTVFDSSYDRGEPIKVSVAFPGIIAGWFEGLQIMPVGSKYMFWISSDLAYGPQQVGQFIKPNSTLEFELELLGIEGKE